jgi:peptidoglycan/LPS O-acetylase OafA/YrhL
VSSAAERGAPPAHFPSLDGIRACSFLLVFAAHAGLQDHVPGGFGVTVFFFLSGYLITTMLRVERSHHGRISIGQFYLRRVLRILPPFYLVLGLAALAALLGLIPGGVSPRALGAQLLHAANYWIVAYGYAGQPAGTGVYWSLAVEEHFYAVFPFLYLLVVRFAKGARAQAHILYGLAAAVLVWRCVLVLVFEVSEDRTYVASDTRVDSILFGCALALWGNPVLDGESRFSERAWKWLLLPSGLLLLLFTFAYRGPLFRETLRYTLQGVGLVPLFVVALRYPAWWPMRFLNLRVMSYLGVLSYPLYLVHHVVLYGLEPVAVAARVPLALALTIALAYVIHELVEKPALVLRKRLSRRSVERAQTDALPALAEARLP